MGNTEYTFWQLHRYGKDKEVFEIIKSFNGSFEGKKVVLKHTDAGLVMKRLGTYDDDNSNTLVPAYGSVTGATFRKVDVYKSIHVVAALHALEKGQEVFTKDSSTGSFKRVFKITQFSRLEIYSFNSLMETEFFIKTSNQDI